MKKKSEKILMCMSGGVDSSVATALLVKQGYDVTGAFMVNYSTTDAENELAGRSAAETCWVNDYRDAVRVAAKLNIPLLKLDFTKEYKKFVLDYMYKEYKLGRTPNPDVLCNKFVKFGVWLETAKKLGFDKMATGHYAKIIKSKDQKIKLLQAKDDNKDQTYFLHQLNQEQLSHVLFPLGDYTKPEVRKLAKKFKLPTAEKEESMGICFIGEVPMKEFLQKTIKVKPGKVVMSDGTVVGKHDGLAFYTIGQRHVGVQSSKFKVQSGNIKPLYVVDKNIKKNQLIVGYEDDSLLYKKQISVISVNWISESGQPPKFPLKCEVRLRHRQPLQKCTIIRSKDLKITTAEAGSRPHGGKRSISIKFNQAQRAVTPGQFAVFYKKGECLGGGVIQ